MKGLKSIKTTIFKPTLTTRLFHFGGFPYQQNIPLLSYLTFDIRGHYHTILGETKEQLRDLLFTVQPYDKTEIVKFKDGGQCLIELMGKRFKEGGENRMRPLVLVLPGLCSSSKTPSVLDMAREGKARGYDVMAINYRGFGGVKLSSPAIYSGSSYEDIRECIEHVCSKYYPGGSRPKIYGVGISMGGNILGNLLAFDGLKNNPENLIEAAFIVGGATDLR